MTRRRVAVLLGGRSSEHDVSVESGRSVIEGLRAADYDVVVVEIDRGGHWRLLPEPPSERGSEPSTERGPEPGTERGPEPGTGGLDTVQ